MAKYFLLFVILATNIYAQNDTLKKISFSGYGEMYYSYDFSNPQNHEKPNFLYNHKRHNELNANLLLVKGNYLDKRTRASIGLMAGNYAEYNLSTEPTWAQYIYEANIGVKLSQADDLWLDIGIMPSHIGFESAIGADCWNLTRSINAENSPYYESGLKLSYLSKSEKLYVSVLFLNGWQKIKKPDFIQKPSFGSQLTYKPSDFFTLNYSNFIGTDKPDSLHTFRHFHNIYFQYNVNSTIGILGGFDIGFEKMLQGKFVSWYSPVLILRQYVSNKTSYSLRGELYTDKNEIILSTGNPRGFEAIGLSANIDFDINDKIKYRTEGKVYHSKEKIFTNNTSRNNVSFTSSLCIRF